MPKEKITIEGVMTYRDEGNGGGPPPDHGGGPPHIWGPTDPRPTPPIVVIPPGSISDGVPTHPIYIPIYPAHPIVIPPGSIGGGKPEHPIYLPPGIWGPTDPFPTPPIFLPPDSIGPGVPTHPIYLPPVIWGPTDPRPSPPIYVPDPVRGISIVYVPARNEWCWVDTQALHPMTEPIVPPAKK